MPTDSPHRKMSACTAPSLSELLAGPLHFVKYVKQFSPVCPEHGRDYCRTLPDHKPPESLRRVAVQDLHKILLRNFFVIGVDGQKRPLQDPLPICCQQAVTRWRQHNEKPERECCLATWYLYNWNEGIAEGLRRPTYVFPLPQCCERALKRYQWWQKLQEKGNIQLSSDQRMSLIRALYDVRWAPYRKSDLDDFIRSVALIYRVAGGEIGEFVRHDGDAYSPFAVFLAHLRLFLPKHMRCRNPKDRQGRACARVRRIFSAMLARSYQPGAAGVGAWSLTAKH